MGVQNIEGAASQQTALEDGTFVIFGITGDLVKRKLLPSLYQLCHLGLLPGHFNILGTTRKQTREEDIISELRDTLSANGTAIDEATISKLGKMLTMVHMDIGIIEDYEILRKALDQFDTEVGKQVNRLYYLAVPPALVPDIVDGLKSEDLHTCGKSNKAESRLLVEKPFGYDTESAIALNSQMETAFDEESIYRVDHYLAKETAQNILTFRFNNPLFKSAWDCQSIDHILISATEDIGIEGRSNFYEQTGALRDLIQSHLLQLLALIAMEEPARRTSDEIHKAKLDLFSNIVPIASENVESDTVRGQYEGYRQEAGNLKSEIETYAAVKLQINNERWAGVPVLLRTGKALLDKKTEITLIFKNREHKSEDINALTIRIQPDEGIMLSLLAKKPSLMNENQIVHMKFFYNQSFDGGQPDAYERVLVDAIRGDKTLFTTDAEIIASWKILENVLESWKKGASKLEFYEQGSYGPSGANDLAEKYGASWQIP